MTDSTSASTSGTTAAPTRHQTRPISRPSRRSRKGRAAIMLEFALLFPLSLFLILFSIDMGRYTFYQGAVADSTYAAARAGAQFGDAGTASVGPAATAFERSVQAVPGLANGTERMQVNGSRRTCTVNQPYIEVTGTVTYDFITPFLGALLSIGDSTPGDNSVDARNGLPMRTTALVPCEVVRS